MLKKRRRRSLAERIEAFELKYQAGVKTYVKRRTEKIMALARAHFNKIKKSYLAEGHRKTSKLAHISRSERMKLAHTQEYAGISLTEEFPRFDANLTIDDLYPFFDALSDVGILEDIIKTAEQNITMPKILTLEAPKLNSADEKTSTDQSVKTLNNLLKPKRIDKSKYQGIKT